MFFKSLCLCQSYASDVFWQEIHVVSYTEFGHAMNIYASLNVLDERAVEPLDLDTWRVKYFVRAYECKVISNFIPFGKSKIFINSSDDTKKRLYRN